MLRALLAVALMAVVALIGFYFGRASVKPSFVDPSVKSQRRPPAPMPTTPDLQTKPDLSAPPVGSRNRVNPPAEPGFGNPAPLMDRKLALPIEGLEMKDMYDSFLDARGGGERTHEATDIMAPRGTPVHAVDNGIIKKLFESNQAGKSIYQFDTPEDFAYFYAHLDRYAEGLKEGMLVKRGDIIGYVGSTGNADPGSPHLHLAIFELGPEKNWWEGKPVTPTPS
jgi:murein DD-endopeptidase MepM/ murein hydrolase activator NlpD